MISEVVEDGHALDYDKIKNNLGLVDVYRSKNNPKIFKGIQQEKLNILHWLLYAKNSDIIPKLSSDKEMVPIIFRGHQEKYRFSQGQIQNISLVMITLSKNDKALVKILQKWPFFYVDDSLDAILLFSQHQWTQGIKIIEAQFVSHFSKCELVDKFSFVIKLFKMIDKYRNNQGVLKCLQKILKIDYVQSYIKWQEKKPQVMEVVHHHVLNYFSQEEIFIIK